MSDLLPETPLEQLAYIQRSIIDMSIAVITEDSPSEFMVGELRRLQAVIGGPRYKFRRVCPRCGRNGSHRSCTDTRPSGGKYTHDETCKQNHWADLICNQCEKEMEARP